MPCSQRGAGARDFVILLKETEQGSTFSLLRGRRSHTREWEGFSHCLHGALPGLLGGSNGTNSSNTIRRRTLIWVPRHPNQKLPLSMPLYCYPTPRILPPATFCPHFLPKSAGKRDTQLGAWLSAAPKVDWSPPSPGRPSLEVWVPVCELSLTKPKAKAPRF